MRALITRPQEDAGAIAEALRGHGIEPVIEPMMTIVPREADVRLDGVQAVLLTSRNGARALAASSARRDLPVLAVGDSTAALARELGYDDVESAAGDVSALAALAVRRLDPASGPLFHGAGRDVAGDLAGALGENGFAVRREVLYEAKPVARLSDRLRDLLSRRQIEIALFFSPRTAQIFVTLISDAGLSAASSSMTCIALSPAVGRSLAELRWRAVRVAARPDTPSMITAAIETGAR